MNRTLRRSMLATTMAAAALMAGGAVQALPAAAASGTYQIVLGPRVTGNASGATVASAACPTGTVVYGAGVTGPKTGEVVIDSLVPSRNRVDATAYVDQDGYSGSWSLQAIAMCGPLLINYSITAEKDTTPSVYGSSVSTSCPGGTNLIGTGFETGAPSSVRGQVVVTDLVPSPTTTPPTTVRVTSAPDQDGVPGAFASTAYRVCASIDGLGVVTRTSPLTSPSYQVLGDVCPSGQQPSGAGYTVPSGQLRVPRLDPALYGSGSLVSSAYEDQDGYGANWSLTLYEICGNF